MDYAQAKRWSSMLFEESDKAHAFYLFELEEPPLVVSGAVVSSTEEEERTDPNETVVSPEDEAVERYPHTLPQVRRIPGGLPGAGVAWVPLSDIQGSSLGARVARIGAARADAFRMPCYVSHSRRGRSCPRGCLRDPSYCRM